MKISRKANAKLNLFLEITGKRPDGYHELESLAVFLDLADELIIAKADKISCEIIDELNHQIEDNIVIRAAEKLAEISGTDLGAKIVLKKRIPVGAGLGGGSANAATTIAGLNEFWKLNLPKPKLYELALSLGADVPVCLYSILENKNAASFKGIGDIIEPAPALNKLYLVLVNPLKELTTEKVFKNFRFGVQIVTSNNGEDFTHRRNDLEPAAIELMPEIAEILEELNKTKNCKLARMTGSGATCFGLFKTMAEANEAVSIIHAKHPEWWVVSAKLKS